MYNLFIKIVVRIFDKLVFYVLRYICTVETANILLINFTYMPTLFYEIFNKKIKLNSETIRNFKQEIERLYNELLEEKNIDNMKVLRNKLEKSLNDNKKKKNYQKIKNDFAEIEVIFQKLEVSIQELEDSQEKIELVDVVKKVEDRYKLCKNIPASKKDQYKSFCIKKSKIKYEKEIIKLQVELLKLQKHIKAKGEKLLIIFEGRDAAGK